MRRCWVIPNGKGEPWLIDNDESKPVYLKNDIPTYRDGEMFNYHLANEPPGAEERCHEIEKGCEGYQFTFEDFMQEEREEERHQELDFSCFASYVTYPGVGVRQGECPLKGTFDEPLDCRDCEMFQVYYDAVDEERKTTKSLSEAHYKVHQRLNIPTAYDEKGQIKNG